MEVCVSLNTSACHDISDNTGSSTDPHNQNQLISSNLSVGELETCLTAFLNIEDIDIPNRGVNLSPATNDICNVVKEDKCKDSDNSKSCNSACEKSLGKSATFPPPREGKSTIDGFSSGKETEEKGFTAAISKANASADSVNQGPSRSISLPTPTKLVSAMKGSREKQGLPPKNSSVTWAPDVYDPIPTSVSHFPSYKNQRYRSGGKRSGKNKQKRGGKSSRGSTGDKDKKQAKKNGGSSSKSKPLDDNSGVAGFSEPKVDAVDFNVGSSPDPFCGSSFLKKSVTKLHFPVAEAT
ncbi:hypothetical protein BUALT_Bualt09G0063500 [Buddleja alternifolia]|uniref:Uncharacterized protein n=1 Tax=Buddleja alternifolia TaxID=168488 RepID=A0AAV6X0F7_9LAMI|nr:hypothetical protein BUALT_Bualt09G0063500 [Buddleja alternifolia]